VNYPLTKANGLSVSMTYYLHRGQFGPIWCILHICTLYILHAEGSLVFAFWCLGTTTYIQLSMFAYA